MWLLANFKNVNTRLYLTNRQTYYCTFNKRWKSFGRKLFLRALNNNILKSPIILYNAYNIIRASALVYQIPSLVRNRFPNAMIYHCSFTISYIVLLYFIISMEHMPDKRTSKRTLHSEMPHYLLVLRCIPDFCDGNYCFLFVVLDF